MEEPDEVVAVGEFIDRLVKKGYFLDGQLSIGYAQLEQGFLNGMAAMYPMGTWYTAVDKTAWGRPSKFLRRLWCWRQCNAYLLWFRES